MVYETLNILETEF